MIKYVSDLETYIKNLKVNEIPFKIVTTGSSKKVETEGVTYSEKLNNKLNGYELNLIKQVKQYAKKLDLNKFPSINSKDIPFVTKKIEFKGNKFTKELYELDLSSAYWNFALQAGVINKTIFEYANKPKVSKFARLIALGNLAKRPLITEFDGTKYAKMYQESESEYAKLFYLCAQYTALQIIDLKRIAEKEGKFLFFWVDAIFFQGEKALIEIKAELKRKGIKYKIYKIDKITRKKDLIEVFSEEHKRKIRPFKFKKTKKIINFYE